MAKPITPEASLMLSFTPDAGKYKRPELKEKTYSYPRFVKPGESQSSAIKRLMRAYPTKLTHNRPASKYPTFQPGMTTAEYIRRFDALNYLRNAPGNYVPTTPAPLYDDTVTAWMEYGSDPS